MFSSAVKVQNYRRLFQMHETTTSNFRNDAMGLDLRVQRKIFETSPVQTLKKKWNFEEMMTTHRHQERREVREKWFTYLHVKKSALRRESTRISALRT